MSRSSDILYTAEYIKNVLYFATVRHGKIIKDTVDTHYFSIDEELVYENYYSDFGPLNLGCLYKYCKSLNEKLKHYLNRQIIVHYTSTDPKKKTNSAYLLASYGVLYLSLSPRDALKPLLIHGQNYRPFQDATQGDSIYTITVLDCLQAIKKARELGFFNFQDFNFHEYDRLDKLQGGDLNWIVPGKFLAFIGPVDYNVSLYHPPEMYIDYFLENNVKMVIRLNKRLYDGNVFTNAGIRHCDLFFPDGTCPPRHILFKFLQISEDFQGGIAVHCKAGLGRTGSLIGCYLIKHYRMSSHEAIGWMRICRPGSVIGQQQGWLEQIEPWLIKQGNIYRKRIFHDAEKISNHEFGVYSIREKSLKQQSLLIRKSPSPSPPPPLQRQGRLDLAPVVRPQASKIRDDKMDNDDEEIFLTSCDLTVNPVAPLTQLKGCVIKSNTTPEDDENEHDINRKYKSVWRKYLCCEPCIRTCNNGLWMLAVRCAKITPKKYSASKLCRFLDMTVAHKTPDKDSSECRVKSPMLSVQEIKNGGNENETTGNLSRRVSGAGEPRTLHSASKASTLRPMVPKSSAKHKDLNTKKIDPQTGITSVRMSQSPIIKNVNDARDYLMGSSLYNKVREKLSSAMTVTPHYITPASSHNSTNVGNITHITPISVNSVSKGSTQHQQKRRLGRSPSPPQLRKTNEQTQATNTLTPVQKLLARDASRSNLREALSKLKLSTPRDNSIGAASLGAASLGARREAPPPKRAPSVRSDERPLATQGDMLNSIKFQRRFRESLHSNLTHDKVGVSYKDKPNIKDINSRISTTNRMHGISTDVRHSQDKSPSAPKNFFAVSRPTSSEYKKKFFY